MANVEWTTDEKFKRATLHADDWLFTHIRVTKLPPDFEGEVPLAFASLESLGFVVATALQRITTPRRVGHFTGEGRDIRINGYDVAPERERSHTLFAEHVPAGTVLGQVGRA